jgi:hypothetical protein
MLAKEEDSTSWVTILKGEGNGHARKASINSKTPYGARAGATVEET